MARRLLAAPFAFGDASARHWRKLSMLKILDWLELHPGATWQQRWDSSGAGPAVPATGGTRWWQTCGPPAGPAPWARACTPGSGRAWPS